MIGSSLGRYEIVAELGRGAMGVVYKARDPIIERHVAIKTLRADFPSEEGMQVRERFLREARSAGRLSHPSIVTIHDVGDRSIGSASGRMAILPTLPPQRKCARVQSAAPAGYDPRQREAIDHSATKMSLGDRA